MGPMRITDADGRVMWFKDGGKELVYAAPLLEFEVSRQGEPPQYLRAERMTIEGGAAVLTIGRTVVAAFRDYQSIRIVREAAQ